ncbi:phenol hydroxylase subunit P4 [Marinobacter sp. TBZ242]|uniref:Phenol hydroxylase subunit P4 n=1 Tax=Marinobacter azerbaijanicus TaxID=3050455 RepID=A0ABT7IDI3_9GAMM|nr:phenol hydroxylase subunit P4 [Marinobacter sp. TBZ242]MDL0431847.1 phenol hydroxylase subunit P4 [Marinobacter sp. TBZ242]
MSVNAISEYKAEPKDRVENFHGMQLLYIYWPHHLMFCSPFAVMVAPDMTFGDFLEQVLKPAVASHPDSARADFLKAEWKLNDEPFTPDVSATMKDSGIDHKSMLTVTTPGLDGISGSGS